MDILTQKQTATISTRLGTIEVQTPSLMKKLEVERRRSHYSNGYIMMPEGMELANMFATLDVIVTKLSNLPRMKDDNSSWDYEQIYDLEALREVYEKVVAWLDSFRKPVAAEQTEMGQN